MLKNIPAGYTYNSTVLEIESHPYFKSFQDFRSIQSVVQYDSINSVLNAPKGLEKQSSRFTFSFLEIQIQ